MNAADLLATARAAGAAFRLGPGDRLQARGLDRLPEALAASIRAQHPSVIDALHAETVARSPLPWCRHGPGWLAILDPRPDGDGTRAHVLPGRSGWG